MIKIKFFKITDPDGINYEALINYVPSSMQEKLVTYRIKDDRVRSIIGKLILKKTLIEEGYPENVLSHLKLDEYQRPFIDDKVDFNISHSGEYIVCAVSKTNRIGIDIENIKPLNIQDFKDILTKDEQDQFLNHAYPLKHFYSLWTQKEAVMKANGKGLSIAFTDVRINNDLAIYEDKEWKLIRLNINDNYESFIAFDVSDSEVKIDEIKIEDLL